MAVHNFYWLFEGLIAGGARPGGVRRRHSSAHTSMALAQSLDRDLLWLRAQGIGAILSLTESPLPATALREHGLQSLHIPIEDGTAPRPNDFLAALDFIDQQHMRRRAVLVHCRVGEGRTGSILAAYLIRQGAEPQAALDQLRAIRPDAVQAPAQQEALIRFARDRAWIL